jgi:hypothetical protein
MLAGLAQGPAPPAVYQAPVGARVASPQSSSSAEATQDYSDRSGWQRAQGRIPVLIARAFPVLMAPRHQRQFGLTSAWGITPLPSLVSYPEIGNPKQIPMLGAD